MVQKYRLPAGGTVSGPEDLRFKDFNHISLIMYFSSVGGSYLKAQLQNNYAKVRCELYQWEIAKKHVHCLANINKSIRDIQNFLKDIKANSGYCTGVQEFSSAYPSNVEQAAAKAAQGDAEIVHLKKTQVGRKARRGKTSALSVQVLKSEVSDVEQRMGLETGTEFGGDWADGVLQFPDDKIEEDVTGKTGSRLHAKNAIRTGKVLGNERSRRSHERKEGKRNTKEARWSVRDENLLQTDGRDLSGTEKKLESAVKGLNSDNKESPQKECFRSFLQTRKNSPNGDQNSNVQKVKIQLPEDKIYKAIYRPSELRQAWTDGPIKNRASPRSLSKVGLPDRDDAAAVSRRHKAPVTASRLKSKGRSASVSERKFDVTERSSTAKHLSSSEKVKIHITLSKTERRRILKELIYNNTVNPDRSFLEREKQALLREKISKFFESLSEQTDSEPENNEDDIFHNDARQA